MTDQPTPSGTPPTNRVASTTIRNLGDAIKRKKYSLTSYKAKAKGK